MRPYALLAFLAATVYADGHEAAEAAAGMPHEDHKDDEMNTAEQLVKAIDDITELFMEEANLIHEGRINP